MSIEKRRTGYCVRWRDSTGTPRSKQVRLWRDAVTLDGEMKRKKAMGELISHERGTIQLDDFWEIWWQNYALPHLTPRTRDVYGRLWRTHVRPALGPRTQVRAICREAVAAAVSRWSTTLASSSVRKVLAVLQGVLERAVEWEYIATNPAKGIRKPRLVTREGRALDHEQIAALLLELPGRAQAVVRVLAGTGLRPGELRALQWCDVSPDHVIVTKAVSSNVIGPTKTGARRQVETRKGLPWTEWWMASGKPNMVALVFPAVDGKGLWTDQGWRMWQRQVFAPAAARAGLKGVVPYDLRHTFASTLIAEGRDIYWIARQLGHSPMMTLTTYGHLFRDSRCTPGVLPSAVRLES